MHPGAAAILGSQEYARIGMNELDIARAISDGRLSSPQFYKNLWLFDIRITGTGVCCRSVEKPGQEKVADDKKEYVKEFAWRDPAVYLNDEFLARCNGLPTIWMHPNKGPLNSEEYNDRNVGSVFLPYIKGAEVWAIAKILDDGAAQMMRDEQLSTSPFVATRLDGKLILADGTECVIEGEPVMLDHIATCERGVWDKGGEPVGVNSTTAGAAIMPTEDEIKAKADAEAKEKDMQAKIDALTKERDDLKAKVDEMPTAMMADKAKRDAEEKEAKEKEEKEAKAKADAEEAEKKVREEEKAKADSIRSELDALKASMTPMSDDAMNALSDAQAKADSVFAAFGEVAPKPMQGEATMSYRRRLAGRLKAHSATYKDADLAKADGVFFDTAEAAIYADAERAAFSATDAKPGQLRPHTVRSKTGHVITTFHGDPAAYRGSFDAPAKTVDSFRTRSTH
jgi:hypothetical protein